MAEQTQTLKLKTIRIAIVLYGVDKKCHKNNQCTITAPLQVNRYTDIHTHTIQGVTGPHRQNDRPCREDHFL